MTKERSEEVLLIAIVLSVALHILLMVYAKSRVMTHVAAGVERQSRRPPMRVTGELPSVRPVRIDAIDDIKAEKDAPLAQENSRVSAPGIDSAGSSAVMPGFENAAAAVVDGIKPKTEDAYRFEEESLKLDERGSVKIPVVEIETPAVRPMTADGGYAGAPWQTSRPKKSFIKIFGYRVILTWRNQNNNF